MDIEHVDFEKVRRVGGCCVYTRKEKEIMGGKRRRYTNK